MWLTLLVMAVAVSLEPFRIGMTVLMLNRPRPLRQLVAFLCGGFAMGVSVGLLVLFVLRPALLGSRHFTLPKVQIVIGVLALLVAAILATGVRLPGTDEEGRLATWGRRLANGSSLWVAALAGLGIALPSVDYLAALAVILASGACATTQLGALVAFNVVAFALVEIPLVAYLVAPDPTRTAMDGLHRWLRSRRRRDVAALLAGIGVLLVIAGSVGL
ncbi:GAP family protein [Mycolicibacterium sp. 050158]|uniref:GAP family protein n=1 Tax=Mycolicibacterium sp. 050158 TaxID=3090602 RepID=UPI00299ECCD3|nr:GAP family protein [Mycolicibacterium sp. 050158]MDX1892305.1 GAP family protein [Mycolicibacterium sp. 050158]